MEQNDTAGMPQVYDYREHDRIWKRVAPDLTPFPELRNTDPMPQAAAEERTREAVRPERTAELGQAAGMQLSEAEENPCCLGSVAMESIRVVAGFLREESSARRYLRSLMALAPTRSDRAAVQKLLNAAGEQQRRLSAIYYLITGVWPRAMEEQDPIRPRRWAEGLRSAYHSEVCGAMNYLRAADGTADTCLSRLLTELGEEKYARAEQVLHLLERMPRRT